MIQTKIKIKNKKPLLDKIKSINSSIYSHVAFGVSSYDTVYNYGKHKEFHPILDAFLLHAGKGFEILDFWFNIYGPNLKNRVVSRFIEKALSNENLEINDQGKQTRCFTFVDDAISAFNLIEQSKKCKNQIFNIGTTVETSITELAKIVIKLSNSKSKIVFKSYEEQFGESYEDIQRRVPSIDKLKKFTGWSPNISLEEGLKKMIEYSRKL